MANIKDTIKKGLKFLADVNRFLKGQGKLGAYSKKDALDGNDYFILLCFSDFGHTLLPPIIRWNFCPIWPRSWRAGSCGWRIKRIY